jgi:hypothetical protein
MRTLGLILIAVGVLGLLAVLNMDTTVYVPSQTIGVGDPSTYAPSQSVHNLGLMFRQLEWLIVSGLVIVCGVLFYGFGELSEQGKAATPAKSTLHQRNAHPAAVSTTLGTIPETPALEKVDFEEGDLDRLLNGERLPPKSDERGRRLTQPKVEQRGLAGFLQSE